MDKTVVELFAGVGGFHIGLTRASDFKIIWANQWEPGKKVQHAFDCYNDHYGEITKCVNEDIALVKNDVPIHTLLVGGFPCQDYSVASTGAKGIEGKKGVLWWEMRDVIESKRPPFVLFENVDRLLKSPAKQRGRDFGVILESFKELGYSVEWRVVNAAEYGFSQRRRRTFIFAYRNDTNYAQLINDQDRKNIVRELGVFQNTFKAVPKIERKKTSSVIEFNFENLVDVSDNFEEKFFNSGVMIGNEIYTEELKPVDSSVKMLLRDVLEDDAEENLYLNGSLEKWQYMKGSKRIDRISGEGHAYVFAEGALSFPDSLDKPSRTMLTSESSRNRSTHVVKDPKTNRLRVLSPVECERLNGFPDNWTEKVPFKTRYFCMGNALVIGIVEKLGVEIAKIIEGEV